jgi:hypothetical protein
VAIDDATRLAHVEMLPDETRRSTTSFLIRALRWFKARGVKIQRVMTDNSSGHITKLLRRTLERLSIRHIRTRPYTPKTNGRPRSPDRVSCRNPIEGLLIFYGVDANRKSTKSAD